MQTKLNSSYYEPLVAYHPEMTTEELKLLALQLRRDIIDIAQYSGTRSGHVGGEMSVADIMAVLYGSVLRLDPQNPLWEERDRMILSKGHNSAAQYAALAFRGIIPREMLFNEMNTIQGILQEHSNMEIPGIEAPTGSLGMGLAAGAGMAWAAKKDGKDYRTYVVLGDGECTEGQVWESAMFAHAYGLDNLVAIVDYNKYIITGNIESIIHIEPFTDKWKAFGWDVSVIDGHDIGVIETVLKQAADPAYAPQKPRAIIANTIKGYPISFMMEDPINFHSAHMTDEYYKICMEELAK